MGNPLEFTDQELLEQFRQEDSKHQAFHHLVRQYQQRLYWHIRKLVIDHDDANDVLQDVFLKAWKSLENFRADSKLYTWLYRIATNESITFLNKKKRRFFLPLGDVEHELAGKLDGSLFTGDQVQRKLQQAILKLPPRQRVVFNMKYFDGMKYEEMAEILEVTIGALKASYHHAVKKIEAQLSDD